MRTSEMFRVPPRRKAFHRTDIRVDVEVKKIISRAKEKERFKSFVVKYCKKTEYGNLYVSKKSQEELFLGIF